MNIDTKSFGGGRAVQQSGMSSNTSVILFDGTVVDVLAPGKDAFSPHRFAVSLYNIQRWNGHLRIPAEFGHNGRRCLDDGDTGSSRYVFYSDLAHCILVAYCIRKMCGVHTSGTSFRRLVRQALLHEAAEAIIGDMVGPFKRLVKSQVKAYESGIDKVAYMAVAEALGLSEGELSMPNEEEAFVLKKADIMAQDIEATIGQKKQVRGINVSAGFVFKPWMVAALSYAVNVTPSGFIAALQTGNVLDLHTVPPEVLFPAENQELAKVYIEKEGFSMDDLMIWTQAIFSFGGGIGRMVRDYENRIKMSWPVASA